MINEKLLLISLSKKNTILFIFILKMIDLIFCEQSYYQKLDDFSFDLRNPRDKKAFYQNFIREGNLIINKHNITMNAALSNSYGLFYSIKVINIDRNLI